MAIDWDQFGARVDDTALDATDWDAFGTRVEDTPEPEPSLPPMAADMPQMLSSAEVIRGGKRYPEQPKQERKFSVLQDEPAVEPVAERSFAPATPENRAAINAAYDAAPPGEREAMAARADWIGQIARQRQAEFGRQDASAAAGTQAAQSLDTRAEERTERLIAQGEQPEFARRAAQEAAARGVQPGKEVEALAQQHGLAEKSDFDFDTKQLFDPQGGANGLNNPLVRGLAKGVAGMSKAATGYGEFLADLYGLEHAKDITRKGSAWASGVEDAIGEHGTMLERNLEGAIGSIAQQLPAMVVGAVKGVQAIPLAAIAVQTFGQEYSDGRKSGQGMQDAATRAGLFAAFEVLGERFGLGDKLKAIAGATHGMPSDKIVSFMWSAFKKEVPGELLTTTGQFATDKLQGGVGLNTQAGFEEYMQQAADTVVQTMMQSALMTGGGVATSKAVRLLSDRRGGIKNREFGDAARALSDTLTSGQLAAPDAAAMAAFVNQDAGGALTPEQAQERMAGIAQAQARLDAMRGHQQADATLMQTAQIRDAAQAQARQAKSESVAAIGQASTVDEAIVATQRAVDMDEQELADWALQQAGIAPAALTTIEAQAQAQRQAAQEALTQEAVADGTQTQEAEQAGAGQQEARAAQARPADVEAGSGSAAATQPQTADDGIALAPTAAPLAPLDTQRAANHITTRAAAIARNLGESIMTGDLPGGRKAELLNAEADRLDRVATDQNRLPDIQSANRQAAGMLRIAAQEAAGQQAQRDEQQDWGIPEDASADPALDDLREQHTASTKALAGIKGGSLTKALRGSLSRSDWSDIGDLPMFYLGKGGRGADISSLVADGGLDEFLPPRMRHDAAMFDEQESAEYIKEAMRTKSYLTYDAQQEIERLGYVIAELEAAIDEILTLREANEQLQIAAEEQRRIDEDTRIFEPFDEEGADGGVDPAPYGQEGAARREAPAQGLTAQPGDLLGDAPNASQQAAANERARRAQQEQAQRNAAPGAEGFALGVEDARNGREVDPNQRELLGQDAAPKGQGDGGRQRFTVSIPVFGNVAYRASAPVQADGRVLSSRVITSKTPISRSNARLLGLPEDKGAVYAWRVSVVQGQAGPYSIVEAMAQDHGRSTDGEVLAHFKPVDQESVERVAPAISRAAREDWQAAQDRHNGGLFDGALTVRENGAVYETDLFGDPVPAPARRAVRAQSARAGLRGDVQPAAEIRDTQTPQGQYFVRTIVGHETQRRLGADLIRTPQDAAQATAYLYKSAVERFDAIVTDKGGKPLAVVGGFKGAVSQTSVYPGTVVGEAVRIPGAAHVWFSHNHPSGNSVLSRADENLMRVLSDAFRGSGIEPKGLMAVSNGKFSFLNAEGVAIDAAVIPSAESAASTTVPVIERELAENGATMLIGDPGAALRVAKDFHKQGGDGILLLNAQYAVAAWVPITDQMRGALRHTGALNAIYRAISESNAAAAILVHDGALDASHPDSRAVTVGNNIAAALAKVDVRPFDIVNVKTGKSLAQTGLPVAAGPMFSRSASTKAAYEARIDALFAGGEAATGTRVLDRSDVMGMLGHPDMPLILDESHLVSEGLDAHPEMTAAQWKKVPEWIENPALAYKSRGRIVLVAPERVAGHPVLMVIDPEGHATGGRGQANVQLLVTAYAKTRGGVPFGEIEREKSLIYWNTQNAPAMRGSGGVQFSTRAYTELGRGRILTEKHLAGWRRANDTQQFVAASAKSGATVATIAAAIRRAYGSLLDKLQAKGLVTLAQTEDEAVEAAAKARAAKTGQPVERELATLRASVKNSVADQTQTEAFERWFSGSKVVDAEGKPLVSRSSLVAARKSAMLEGRMNGGSSNAKSIADLLVSQAFSLKGLGGLEIPAQRKVLNGVLSLGNDFKVLRSVVDLVPVDVVNILTGKNLAPEVLFRDEAMLKQLLSADRDGSVSTAIDIADALVAAVAGVAAKGSAIASNPFAGTQKVGSAADTGDADVLHEAILNQATGNNGNFDPNDLDIRRSANGAIQGFYDPQSGQSFLIADGLTAEAAPGVLMHEVGIHMAADGSMKALFNRAAMMLKMQRGNPFMKAVQARMDAAGETSGEEAAAYIAEAYENDRANAPASVQRWLADLLAAVKAWMFKKGVMGADRLTVADIAAVARANARAAAGSPVSNGETSGQVRRSNASPTEDEVRALVAQYVSDKGAPSEAQIREAVRQFRETERVYGGRDGYQKAKDAGRTKLTYGQWVQVRTENFRNWFGNWEAVRAQQRLDAMAPVTVNIPDEWRGMDHVALRERMAEALDRMVTSQTTIPHSELGEIRVGREGAKKSENAARDPAKSLVTADIKAVLPQAIVARSEPSRGGDGPDIAGYSTLLVRVNVDGVPLVAAFAVRHQSDGKWYYSSVALHDAQEKTRDSYGRPDQQAGSSVAPIAGLHEFSRRSLKRVNPDSVSKVVDPQTGEPLVVYHGTHGDFAQFKVQAGAATDSGMLGSGHYFANDPQRAGGWYANKRDRKTGEVLSGGNVMPVFLNARNPLAIRLQTGQDLQPVLARLSRDMGLKRMPSMSNDEVNAGWAPLFTQALRERGHDGVRLVLASGVTQEFNVFDGAGAKSATGNIGTFDGGKGDIRFSRASNPAQGNMFPLQPFTLPDEKLALRRTLQDSFIRALKVQNAVAEQGGVVNESTDFYLAEELSSGKRKALADDLREKEIRPLVERMAALNVDMDELALYAYAMHAHERNAQIAKINPNFADGGSGMTNAEADAVFDQVRAEGREQAFAELHTALMDITQGTRRLMRDSGLITAQQYQAMQSQYQNYIPLRGFEAVEDDGRKTGMPAGRGINIRGSETVRALGRASRAGNLIETAIVDRLRAIDRSERNQVGKVFLNFVRHNPDPTLWEIDATRTRQALDQQTGQVKRTFTVDKGEDTISVKVAGREVYIRINDPLLLRALRNTAKEERGELEVAMMRSVGLYSTLLRNTLTRYNPEFALTNAARDFGFGAAAVVDELGEAAGAKFMRYYAGAIGAAHRYEKGSGGQTGKRKKDEWDRYFTEFRMAGGMTAGFYVKGVDEVQKDVRAMLLDAGAKSTRKKLLTRNPAAMMLRKAGRVLEWSGSVSENAARVAAYRVAREAGKTPSQAASIAKNLTTNFDRKGEYGQALNALYVFYNAAVQGSHRMFKMLANPRMLAWMAGMSAAGITTAMLSAFVGGDDPDDGIAYWDKIPDYVKERNFIIMLPPGVQMEGTQTVGTQGRYIKIPLQYGLNLPIAYGYVIADLIRNQRDPNRGMDFKKAAVTLTSYFFGAFNPFDGSVDLGNKDSVVLAALPSTFDFLYQQAAGVNGFGRPAAPFKSEFDHKPDSENYNLRQADSVALKVARWLNSSTGGNAAKPGAVDVSAGTIENLIRNLTGGTGTFIYDSVNLAWNAVDSATGGDPDVFVRDVPLARRVYGTLGGDVDQGIFYENRKQADEAFAAAKGQLKIGIQPEPEERAKAMMHKAGTKVTRTLAKIRREMIRVTEDENLSKEQRTTRLRELRAKRDQLTSMYNQRFREAMGKFFAEQSSKKESE